MTKTNYTTMSAFEFQKVLESVRGWSGQQRNLYLLIRAEGAQYGLTHVEFRKAVDTFVASTRSPSDYLQAARDAVLEARQADEEVYEAHDTWFDYEPEVFPSQYDPRY
jgi:hypothetical protein